MCILFAWHDGVIDTNAGCGGNGGRVDVVVLMPTYCRFRQQMPCVHAVCECHAPSEAEHVFAFAVKM